MPRIKPRFVSSILALAVTFAVPAAASAQEPSSTSQAEVPVQATVAPSPLALEAGSSAPLGRSDVRQGSFAAELASGFLGYAIGASIAYWHVSTHWDDGDGSANDLFFGFIGISAATALVAIPVGVTLAGDATGGRGTYWGALAGSFLGSLAGGGVAGLMAVAEPSEPLLYGGMFVGLALPLVGALIGYDVAARNRSATESSPASGLAHLQPSFAFDPHTRSARVVLGGAF